MHRTARRQWAYLALASIAFAACSTSTNTSTSPSDAAGAQGDVVVFAKYAGTELKLDGEEFLVLRATDLIGILPNG